MDLMNLWWECPKCGNKINFGYNLSRLFDKDDNQAWFEPDSGVPFYIIKCDTMGCKATWNFGISPMYEE